MPLLYDVPFSDYLAMSGVHFSTLKHMSTSPLHYRRACDRERADTPQLRLGRLVHALVLTPELPPDVAMYDGKARRGKAWRAFEEEATAAGKLIVREDELATARRISRAVQQNAQASALLEDGAGEVTLAWDEQVIVGDAPRSVRCRARVDWLCSKGIVELKTTRWPSPRSWAREVAARSYHVQHAHYRAGVESEGGDPGTAWWIVVENVPPHDVAVYRVGANDLETGERVRQGWLRQVAECEASGRWPGVGGDAPIDFQLPDYAVTEGLDDVDMSGIEGGANDG